MATGGVVNQLPIQEEDLDWALVSARYEASLSRRGKGKYPRGTCKKRVVNKGGWRSEMSKSAKNLGLAHESLKTGNIMAPSEVM